MDELLAWQNVIFWAPMVVGTLLYVVSTLAGGDSEHGDAESDIHPDIGSHAEVASGDANAQPSHEGDFHGGLGSFFGLGKVPLAAILASLLFGWGIAGMVMNQIVGRSSILLSMAVSGVAALAFTRLATRLLSRYIPAYESYSQTGISLYLQEGEVLYTVSDKNGTVRVLDKYNNLRDLHCRVRPGEPAIPKGEKVYIDDYDERSQTYYIKLSL